jgi:hypothetical protein
LLLLARQQRHALIVAHDQQTLALDHGRGAAKYSGTTGMSSARVYCQTSSSVQFDSGKHADRLALGEIRVL